MGSRRSRRLAALLALGVLPGIGLGTGVGWSVARLTSVAAIAGNTFGTAASFDTVPPTVSAAVVAKSGQYFAGFVKQGGTYFVYANATDAGASPSGIATITADVSALTSGQAAAPLAAGSYTVGGVAYGYRSAALSVKNPLAAGANSFSLTATDNNANSATQSGLGVTVDNTAPAGSDIQCDDGGGTTGTIELGDTCTFTFSEIIDPESILTGWTGPATNVVVVITDMGPNDRMAIWDSANTAALNLGSINLKGDFVNGPDAHTAGASGIPSTMVLDTSTNSITITFGTIAGGAKHVNKKNTMQWTPSAGAFDPAGNAMSTTNVNETDKKDLDF
jgi:hypothetical protein